MSDISILATDGSYEPNTGSNAISILDQNGSLMVNNGSNGISILSSTGAMNPGSPELVRNGRFGSTSHWTTQAGWAISGGTVIATNAASGTAAIQAGVVAVGKSYIVTYTISSRTIGGIRIASGSMGYAGTTRTVVGTYTDIITPTIGTSGNLAFEAVGTTTATMTFISARETATPVYSILNADGSLKAYTPGSTYSILNTDGSLALPTGSVGLPA